MAFVLEDRVVETANNPGQGDFELLGATDNNRTFVAAIGNGNTTRYLAIGAEGAEIGVAQVQAGSPDRLLRPGTVKNMDGTTAPVNFTGTVTVACVASIEDVLWLNENGDLPPRGGRDLGTDGDRWRNAYLSGSLDALSSIAGASVRAKNGAVIGDGSLLRLGASGDGATGGSIEVRPRGTPDPSNRTIFYNNGDVELTAGMLLISGRRLVEGGQNSNGRYVRFSDGTQICWREMPNLGPIETTTGPIYRSTSYSWNYPASFTSIQSVVGQGVRNNVSAPPVWLGFSLVGLSNSSFWLVASTNNSSTAFLAELVAFGRWY